jgi:hypothetical protein
MVKSPKKKRKRSRMPDSSPFGDSHDENMYKIRSDDDSKFFTPGTKNFTLAPCNSADRGLIDLLYS